jgi:cell division protein FtsB
MATTLRKQLDLEIERIDERTRQLEEFISLYKDNNDYESAMKCDIKRRQLGLVSENLKKII